MTCGQDLLSGFFLSNNFFIYNDCTYKQVHESTKSSPVSGIVANLCMETIAEQAIQSATTPPNMGKRYVDDSFSVLKKSAVAAFL